MQKVQIFFIIFSIFFSCSLHKAQASLPKDHGQRNYHQESLKAIAEKEEKDYSSFLRNIHARVQEAWDPPLAGEVTVNFQVSASSGQLVPNSIVVTEASSKQLEDATIKAIENASVHFRPVILSSNRKDEVDIHIELKSE